MKGFVIGVAATAIAFAVVAYILPQVDFQGDAIGLILLAIVFGVVNALIKPIVKLLSFPINAMTLGLFSLVINAALLLLVSWITREMFKVTLSIGGFPADGLSVDAVVAAFIASVLLSIVSTVVGLVVHD